MGEEADLIAKDKLAAETDPRQVLLKKVHEVIGPQEARDIADANSPNSKAAVRNVQMNLEKILKRWDMPHNEDPSLSKRSSTMVPNLSKRASVAPNLSGRRSTVGEVSLPGMAGGKIHKQGA